MSDVILEAFDGPVTPIHALTEAQVPDALAADAFAAALAKTADFKGKAGQVLQVPAADGTPDRVLYGLGDGAAPGAWRGLPARLPAGVYRLAASRRPSAPTRPRLAFALGSYRSTATRPAAASAPAAGRRRDVAEVRQVAPRLRAGPRHGQHPANDMGPLQIETIAREIAEQHGAADHGDRGRGPAGGQLSRVHAVGRPPIRPARRG
jgi:leucyl aminopeptidase